jgi:hypothetical protein
MKHPQFILERSVAMHAQHTFETFLTGPSNTLAFAHVRAVADAPAVGNPQPLYLYGPVSTGKSHLLEAIETHLRETSPETKVLRVLFDIFLAELIWSFTKGDNAGFLEKYTAPDVLMIDDLHFIRGKEASGRYLMEIIRANLEKGHRVILTSTCPLKDLDTLNDPPVCLEVPYRLLSVFAKVTVSTIAAAGVAITDEQSLECLDGLSLAALTQHLDVHNTFPLILFGRLLCLVCDVRQLAMLRPGSAVVPGLLANVIHSGDLHTILPSRGGFHRQTISDVDTNVTGHPNHLAHLNGAEVRADITAHIDHGVLTDVRHTIGAILSTAVALVGITTPAPQQSLDETNTIEAKGVCRGSINLRSSVFLSIVTLRVLSSLLLVSRHRPTKAASYI